MREIQSKSMRQEERNTTQTLRHLEPKSVKGQSVVTNLGAAMTGLSFDELRERGMPRTERDTGAKLEKVELEEIQPTVLKPQSVNLSEEISASLNLIESTATVFRNSLSSLSKSRGGGQDLSEGLVDLEKIKTGVFLGKTINDLIKTKIEALKLYHESCPEEEYEDE